MKLLILGYGRGGKDTLANCLYEEFGLSHTSSSMFACKLFIFDVLKGILNYRNIEECYNDRYNYRALWHELIKAYNSGDKARLARELLDRGYQLYVGMRCHEELEESRDLFDLVIWVDGVERTGYVEPIESCTVTPDMADIIISNNGTEEEFLDKVRALMNLINK